MGEKERTTITVELVTYEGAMMLTRLLSPGAIVEVETSEIKGDDCNNIVSITIKIIEEGDPKKVGLQPPL
jgi:hypothetical protein